MGVTSYYSFGGEILGEETGGVRRDYLTDSLGSVTATVTGAGTVENTYRYKPYGERLAKTGTGSDPKFLWNGKWGYRASDHSDLYIRKRHYSVGIGRWTILDPKYKFSQSYVYCNNNSTNFIDYSGLTPITIQFGAFIHKRHGEWLDVYHPKIWPRVYDPFWLYKGDNRIQGGGSYRVFTVATIETEMLDTNHAVRYVGTTPGESTRKSKVIPGWIEKQSAVASINRTEKSSGGCAAFASATVRVTNPFKPSIVGGQEIDYTVHFRVSVRSKNVVDVSVFMWHDQFPDYELITSYSGLRYHYPAPAFIEGLDILAVPSPMTVNDIVPASTPRCCKDGPYLYP